MPGPSTPEPSSIDQHCCYRCLCVSRRIWGSYQGILCLIYLRHIARIHVHLVADIREIEDFYRSGEGLIFHGGDLGLVNYL
jgi:hypothetical protein